MKKKFLPYIVPTLILIGGLVVILSVAYYGYDRLWEKDKSITFLLSGLGLVFAVFQVTLNIKVQDERNKAALRHTEYKELTALLNSVSNLMNLHMTDEPKVEELVSTLMNKKNDYASFLIHNNTYLFKGIENNQIMKQTFILMEDLLVRTDKYRYELDDVETNKLKGTERYFFEEGIKRMEWHNEVRDILKRYNTIKHQALREVQKYIE